MHVPEQHSAAKTQPIRPRFIGLFPRSDRADVIAGVDAAQASLPDGVAHPHPREPTSYSVPARLWSRVRKSWRD